AGGGGQAEAVFGWREDEVLGRPLADTIIPPALRSAHASGLARYLASGEARVLGRRIELTGIRRDGTEFPVELAIAVIGSGRTRTKPLNVRVRPLPMTDRKSTRLNSSHEWISYAVCCLTKKIRQKAPSTPSSQLRDT